jgi:hypothetical protein
MQCYRYGFLTTNYELGRIKELQEQTAYPEAFIKRYYKYGMNASKNTTKKILNQNVLNFQNTYER